MPPAIAVLSGPRLYSSAVPSYSFLTSTPGELLNDRISAYAALRSEGQWPLNRFWLQLYDDWFERWPVEEVSKSEKTKKVSIVIQLGPELINCLL